MMGDGQIRSFGFNSAEEAAMAIAAEINDATDQGEGNMIAFAKAVAIVDSLYDTMKVVAVAMHLAQAATECMCGECENEPPSYFLRKVADALDESEESVAETRKRYMEVRSEKQAESLLKDLPKGDLHVSDILGENGGETLH